MGCMGFFFGLGGVCGDEGGGSARCRLRRRVGQGRINSTGVVQYNTIRQYSTVLQQ